MNELAEFIIYIIAEIFGIGISEKIEDFFKKLPRVIIVFISILSILIIFLIAYLLTIWFG
jgi:hypothetical protein